MRVITKRMLKHFIGLHTSEPYFTVGLQTIIQLNGTCRLYIDGIKTPFHIRLINKYDRYDKELALVADFINYWYGENICIGGGVKINSTELSEKYGILYEHICKSKGGNIYLIKAKK